MTAENHSNGRAELPEDGASVLANLPRTRPQRATARRAAAREKAAPAPPRRHAAKTETAVKAEPAAKAPVAKAPAATKAERKAEPAKKAEPKAARAASKPAARKTAAPKAAGAKRERGGARAQTRRPLEPVPRQGFESESDHVSGPVQPFGATELIGAATEAFGEIAKAGLSGGERLLKDALSLLSR